ncbi:hypothetical protein ACM7LX_34320, partial [Pseudomonas aeruginosa]
SSLYSRHLHQCVFRFAGQLGETAKHILVEEHETSTSNLGGSQAHQGTDCTLRLHQPLAGIRLALHATKEIVENLLRAWHVQAATERPAQP